DLASAAMTAAQALDELVVDGVDTNVAMLRTILTDPEFVSGEATTGFVDARTWAVAESTETGAADALTARVTGTVVAIHVEPGDVVGPRTAVLTLEAMKMEHPVTAGRACRIDALHVAVGDTVAVGHVLATVAETDEAHVEDALAAEADLDHIRPDLAELHERRRLLTDEARPEAVAKRHA